MSRIFTCSAVAVLGALLLLAGCSKQLDRASTEVVERTYPIDPRARLTIRNLSGSISIRGSDTEELKLQATKRAESQEELKDINMNVVAETGSISISTSMLPQKKGSHRAPASLVDYVLIVPRTITIARLELEEGKVLIEGMTGEGVRANVVDGQVTVRNCSRNIYIALANGDLDLSYQDWGEAPFTAYAQITHGNARISIPRTASFHARAQTGSGKISNDFADMVQLNGGSLREIDLSVGPNARAELAVRVTTGDISIAAVGSVPASGQQTASVEGSE
jgi:DUF4097 and DUF4098 domain-containing protein YvlB